MTSHTTARVHPWLLDVAKGFEQYLVDGYMEFSWYRTYKIASLARYLALLEDMTNWQKHDFEGVDITQVDIPWPEGVQMYPYGNFARASELKPWESKAKDVTTKVTIRARVPGAILLKPEDFAPDMPSAIVSKIRKSLGEKLERAFQLPRTDVDWLSPYTADALLIGRPDDNRSEKRFENEVSYFNKLLNLHGHKDIPLQFGHVLESCESHMIVQAVWKEIMGARDRERVREALYRHLGLPGTVYYAEFLVW